MDVNLDKILRAELDILEQANLRRHLRVTHGGTTSSASAFAARTGAQSDDPEVVPPLNFAANDYLGLSHHPALIEASRLATSAHGTGAGASRLVTGTNAAVIALEEHLAAWKETEATLVFSSGFAAALGTIPALVGKGDTIILDKLAHASLIDGARLSGATIRIFPHNNMEKLEALLRKLSAMRAHEKSRLLIVTESIFSMDGDSAPLREIVELKDRYGAWLMVDEAHATGLYGTTGAGLVSQAGLSSRVEIIMGTLSKALGSVGGYIAGSRVLIDWLINRARSFIYSTALPPGAIAASHVAIQLACGSEGEALRHRLRENIAQFRAGLPAHWVDAAFPSGGPLPGGQRLPSAIQPLICGEASAALKLAASLREQGYLIPAIRFPTVARNAARLRVTLSAAHSAKDINALNDALAGAR